MPRKWVQSANRRRRPLKREGYIRQAAPSADAMLDPSLGVSAVTLTKTTIREQSVKNEYFVLYSSSLYVHNVTAVACEIHGQVPLMRGSQLQRSVDCFESDEHHTVRRRSSFNALVTNSERIPLECRPHCRISSYLPPHETSEFETDTPAICETCRHLSESCSSRAVAVHR